MNAQPEAGRRARRIHPVVDAARTSTSNPERLRPAMEVAQRVVSNVETVVHGKREEIRLVLSAFVRGRVYLHFGSEDEARAALLEEGFRSVEITQASELAPAVTGAGSRMAHIIEAPTS